VLSFAPGERFFPTLPFFMALDGDPLGNDSVKADFEDPWEVAPYLRDSANRGTHQQVILGFALHPLLASGYRPAYHR